MTKNKNQTIPVLATSPATYKTVLASGPKTNPVRLGFAAPNASQPKPSEQLGQGSSSKIQKLCAPAKKQDAIKNTVPVMPLVSNADTTVVARIV